MADASLLATPIPVPWTTPSGTHTFHLCKLTYGMMAQFQVWQEGEAALAIMRHRKLLGEEAYREQMDGWRHDLGAKVYVWGSRESWRALWSEPGTKQAIYLKLKAGEEHGSPPVDLHLVDRMAEDVELWTRLVGLLQEQDFPNVMSPVPPGEP